MLQKSSRVKLDLKPDCCATTNNPCKSTSVQHSKAFSIVLFRSASRDSTGTLEYIANLKQVKETLSSLGLSGQKRGSGREVVGLTRSFCQAGDCVAARHVSVKLGLQPTAAARARREPGTHCDHCQAC